MLCTLVLYISKLMLALALSNKFMYCFVVSYLVNIKLCVNQCCLYIHVGCLMELFLDQYYGLGVVRNSTFACFQARVHTHVCSQPYLTVHTLVNDKLYFDFVWLTFTLVFEWTLFKLPLASWTSQAPSIMHDHIMVLT